MVFFRDVLTLNYHAPVTIGAIRLSGETDGSLPYNGIAMP